MKKPFTVSNYGWNIDGLERCIKENKLKSKILFATEKAAIVHVVSYSESEILGAESTWCISQHKVSWEQYVEKTKGVQLFIYNFNYSVSEDYSLYGVTFQVKNDLVKTYCGFTRENHPIGKARGFDTDEEAVMSVINISFGNIFEGLAYEILDIHSKTYPKEKKKTTINKVKNTKAKNVCDAPNEYIYAPAPWLYDDWDDWDYEW